MASTIVSRTISAVVDKRASMTNATWVRPIPFGTSWTKLRLGIRMQMTDTGSGLTSAQFFMGVCSGSTNIFGDETTTHACGWRSTGVWTRETSGSAVHYHPTGGTMKPTKRVGSTITDGTAFFPVTACRFNARAASEIAARTVIFVDVLKGSPNFTFQLFGYTDSTAEQDVSRDTFLVEVARAIPSISNYTQSATQTLAVNEADGSLNHVGIHWDQSVPMMELCDIAVSRLQ